jgi:dTDP-4-dehydrorhamnose 3,5-epimerase
LGQVETLVLKPGTSVFVPSGVANGYQTIENMTSYVYLVSAHWDPEAKYSAIDPFDSELDIPWPIKADDSVMSEKDRHNPALILESSPGEPSGVITGANGQLGKQLTADFPFLRPMTRQDCEISNSKEVSRLAIGPSDVVINAAACTAVDFSETPEGMSLAFRTNVLGVQNLSEACANSGAILVHYSTDFVFDGNQPLAYGPSSNTSPINVYGVTKAAGEIVASRNPKTYVLRTSWVFGDGENFVRKIFQAATNGQEIRVVDDQFGRPTSTSRLSEATRYLLDHRVPFGTYHVTCAGPLVSRYELAKFIYQQAGFRTDLVIPVKTKRDGETNGAQRPLLVDLGPQEGLFGLPAHWRNEVQIFIENLKKPVDAKTRGADPVWLRGVD